MDRRAFLIGSALGMAASPWVAGQALAAPFSHDPVFGRTFNDLQGRSFEMSDCLGAPVIMNFWATWCPPCVEEMPDLEALHERFGPARFLGMAVDTKTNVEGFLKKVQVSYPILLLGHGGIELMRGMGNKVGGLPFTIVFDARGRVATRILGQVDPTELSRTIEGLLA